MSCQPVNPGRWKAITRNWPRRRTPTNPPLHPRTGPSAEERRACRTTHATNGTPPEARPSNREAPTLYVDPQFAAVRPTCTCVLRSATSLLCSNCPIAHNPAIDSLSRPFSFSKCPRSSDPSQDSPPAPSSAQHHASLQDSIFSPLASTQQRCLSNPSSSPRTPRPVSILSVSSYSPQTGDSK